MSRTFVVVSCCMGLLAGCARDAAEQARQGALNVDVLVGLRAAEPALLALGGEVSR